MIIRENRFFGFGRALTIEFDDVAICKLHTGEYIKFGVESGFHTLGLSASIIKEAFVSNQKYYFLIKASSEDFGFEIERIDDDIGNYLISTSRAIK